MKKQKKPVPSAEAEPVIKKQPLLKRLLFGPERPDLSKLEAGSTTILDILSPTAIDTKSRDYIVVDGVFHAYLYITGYGYSTTVGSCWLAPLVEAGEGVNVSFSFTRQNREKILSKIAQTTMLNRSRMRDVGDTRQDYEELDSAITSGLYLKDVMNRQGEDFYYILAELDKPTPEEESKLMTYGAAAHWFQQPVYLLPCDDTGVTQLQIMAQPDYRQRLTRLALKGHYHPPPPEYPCWDALFQGQPFVLAADMELRRVDAAYTLAREQGYSQLVLAALPQQVAEVWGPRYRDTGKARVFTLTEDAITQLLGKTPKPYRPPDTPYVTEKGEMIHAPLIKAAGKAGGYR